ncbi:uncharacterized protein [Lolium perenne]|uniref:uncharacterized protein isoform X2 n=1 Tax=Lolium perenne TaxID=4522 RepID=UPI003A998034
MLDTPAMPAGDCEKETAHKRIFKEFMAGVARFEELVDGGRQFLARFQQELDYFQRPLVESDVIEVHSCEAELQGYINKVNALVEELQCLVEDAYAATLTANLSATKVLDYTVADNSTNDASHFTEEKEEQPANQLHRDSSLVMVMILVHNMLKLDYTMQEKIVMSLSLKSSSAELQSYCLMWDLRPYVDGKVMDLAWKSCP